MRFGNALEMKQRPINKTSHCHRRPTTTTLSRFWGLSKNHFQPISANGWPKDAQWNPKKNGAHMSSSIVVSYCFYNIQHNNFICQRQFFWYTHMFSNHTLSNMIFFHASQFIYIPQLQNICINGGRGLFREIINK